MTFLNWPIVRIRHLARIVNGGTPPSSGGDESFGGTVAWATPEDLGNLKGASLASTRRMLSPTGLATCSASVCPPGSLVVSTRAPIGYIAVAGVPITSNQGCRILVPRTGKVPNSKFLYYALVAERDELQSRGRGSTFTELSTDELGDLPIAVPTALDQLCAVAYLDRKTAAIDSLIEKKERLLVLLAEKRAAVISQAVTKGLDPTVPMKDSGVPWIGEVPAHWSVARLKFLVDQAVAGPYGSSLTKSMYSDAGFRVYGQQQVIPDDFLLGDYYISAEKFAEMRQYEVHPGDVLVSVMGTVGKVAVVPNGVERGIINPRLVRYKPDYRRVLSRFLQRAIQSHGNQACLQEAAQGTTMDGLNMQILGDLFIAVAPLPEQWQIVAEVDRVSAQAESMTRLLVDQIGSLREYRQALITAAVTGQIDVTAEVQSVEW